MPGGARSSGFPGSSAPVQQPGMQGGMGTRPPGPMPGDTCSSITRKRLVDRMWRGSIRMIVEISLHRKKQNTANTGTSKEEGYLLSV